jgi:hypothetical protein
VPLRSRAPTSGGPRPLSTASPRETAADSEPEIKPETAADSEPEIKSETAADSKPAHKPDTVADVKSDSQFTAPPSLRTRISSRASPSSSVPLRQHIAVFNSASR